MPDSPRNIWDNRKYQSYLKLLNEVERPCNRVVNQARAFRVGGVKVWILKNCRASIGLDSGAKSRFSVSGRV